MELTATQIEALEAAGGSRWTKSGHDRIYFALDTIPGVGRDRRSLLTVDGETFSRTRDAALAQMKLWVDVATGQVHTQNVTEMSGAAVAAETIVDRFGSLVAGLLAVEEITTTPDETEAAEAAAVVETIRVRVASHVPTGRRARLVRNLVKHHGGVEDGDLITLPAEVWAQPREYGEMPAPGRWAEIPRGQGALVSQGNLEIVE